MGVVTAVGEGVTGVSPGQRVTAMGWQANQGQGSWQQYVNIKAELVVSGPGPYLSPAPDPLACAQLCFDHTTSIQEQLWSCPLPRPSGHHLGSLRQQLCCSGFFAATP